MTRRIAVICALVLLGSSVSGCAPLLGAGAAIVIDDAAEREGGNLF